MKNGFALKCHLTRALKPLIFQALLLKCCKNTRSRFCAKPALLVFGCKKERHGLGPCRSWGSSGALFYTPCASMAGAASWDSSTRRFQLRKKMTKHTMLAMKDTTQLTG